MGHSRFVASLVARRLLSIVVPLGRRETESRTAQYSVQDHRRAVLLGRRTGLACIGPLSFMTVFSWLCAACYGYVKFFAALFRRT